MLQMNNKVNFFLSGLDLTDHEKWDKNRTMKLLKACTTEQVAWELLLLAGATKMAVICGIPFRAGLQSVFPQANDLYRQAYTNYSFVGMSKGPHRVNDRYGIHLSNWQLGKYMMTLGQRLFGWPKRSQQFATKNQFLVFVKNLWLNNLINRISRVKLKHLSRLIFRFDSFSWLSALELFSLMSLLSKLMGVFCFRFDFP